MNYSTYLKKYLSEGDFTNYPMKSYEPSKNGMENCLYKIINILSKKNKNITFIWNEDNKRKFHSSGWFGYTIIGNILINGKDYSVLFNWRDNYQHTTSYFKINGIEVISLTTEYIHWDAGCSTTNNNLKINNEIDNILK